MGLEQELYYKPWILFYIIQTVGLSLFILGIYYKFRVYFQGQRPSIYGQPKYWQMFKAFIREVIFQRQLLQKSFLRWLIHLMIFYGFLGLISLSAIAVFLKMVPESSELWQFMMQGEGYGYYKLAGDSFGLLLFLGIILSFARRYLFRDMQLHSDTNDNVALILLLSLVLTGFALEAARISLSTVELGLNYSFVGSFLAALFRGQEGVNALASNFWVLHATLNAVFFAYIPHSKFMHVMNAPIEIVLNASEEHARRDLYL